LGVGFPLARRWERGLGGEGKPLATKQVSCVYTAAFTGEGIRNASKPLVCTSEVGALRFKLGIPCSRVNVPSFEAEAPCSEVNVAGSEAEVLCRKVEVPSSKVEWWGLEGDRCLISTRYPASEHESLLEQSGDRLSLHQSSFAVA
jgi:hypothetical protein